MSCEPLSGVGEGQITEGRWPRHRGQYGDFQLVYGELGQAQGDSGRRVDDSGAASPCSAAQTAICARDSKPSFASAAAT